MDIQEFVSKFRNHPVLFIGTGISLRYLNKSFTWDGILKKTIVDLTNNEEKYLDLKALNAKKNIYDYASIALEIEKLFEEVCSNERKGKFKRVNDRFYEMMRKDTKCSRFKIYLSDIFDNLEIKKNKQEEISELKKARKNIGSIITTNYDCFVEKIFEFLPLIGNDILLSNPYGSVYKIHGCVTQPQKIIITSKDYEEFSKHYELIRAQLLSIFIHNPIIFLGYGIGDENIKNILKTIFTYVQPNSNLAEKIRKNFLLIEYEKDNLSKDILEHDIELEKNSTIRINKIKTDNFIDIYKSLSDLTLPISAMDIRKVQNIVKEIYSGGNIKVSITEDIDNIKNSEKILAIGTDKTIKYEYQTTSEMMKNYFNIIDESNSNLLELTNKQVIQTTQYFPIFGFSKICKKIQKESKLKKQQREKIEKIINDLEKEPNLSYIKNHNNIAHIDNDETIAAYKKINLILWNVYKDNILLSDLEQYLRKFENKNDTPYRKLLCMYDLKKYS